MKKLRVLDRGQKEFNLQDTYKGLSIALGLGFSLPFINWNTSIEGKIRENNLHSGKPSIVDLKFFYNSNRIEQPMLLYTINNLHEYIPV